MTLIESIIERAKSNKQRIVLPESMEERTITAADRVLADDIADIILIGNPDEIKSYANKLGLKHMDKATIIDPATSEKTEEYAQLLFQLRQKKGMTIETLFISVVSSSRVEMPTDKLAVPFQQQETPYVLLCKSSNALLASLV